MADKNNKGALARIFGAKPPSGDDSTGQSLINRDRILQHSDPNVPSPTQPPNWYSMRSIAIETTPRYFTQAEAAELTDMAKELKQLAASTEKAYEALKSIDDSDTRVDVAHYDYLEHIAGNEAKRLGAKTRLGKALHGLRPVFEGYSRSLQLAEAHADKRIELQRAQFNERLSGIRQKQLPSSQQQPHQPVVNVPAQRVI